MVEELLRDAPARGSQQGIHTAATLFAFSQQVGEYKEEEESGERRSRGMSCEEAPGSGMGKLPREESQQGVH